mmetsp:Transcript_23436/g.61772  ORF Transcript_23436/g.61772 Transcript_23436/m.61772 type:complete len:362 (-) Transcript_23436:508-1593(-)
MEAAAAAAAALALALPRQQRDRLGVEVACEARLLEQRKALQPRSALIAVHRRRLEHELLGLNVQCFRDLLHVEVAVVPEPRDQAGVYRQELDPRGLDEARHLHRDVADRNRPGSKHVDAFHRVDRQGHHLGEGGVRHQAPQRVHRRVAEWRVVLQQLDLDDKRSAEKPHHHKVGIDAQVGGDRVEDRRPDVFQNGALRSFQGRVVQVLDDKLEADRVFHHHGRRRRRRHVHRCRRWLQRRAGREACRGSGRRALGDEGSSGGCGGTRIEHGMREEGCLTQLVGQVLQFLFQGRLIHGELDGDLEAVRGHAQRRGELACQELGLVDGLVRQRHVPGDDLHEGVRPYFVCLSPSALLLHSEAA